MSLGDIVYEFFTFLDNLKLYHWTCTSYARHKASDELHEEMSKLVDHFVEAASSNYGRPTVPDGKSSVPLHVWSDDDAVTALQDFSSYLTVKVPQLVHEDDVDLLNVRDEMVTKINNTVYLFTFS